MERRRLYGEDAAAEQEREIEARKEEHMERTGTVMRRRSRECARLLRTSSEVFPASADARHVFHPFFSAARPTAAGWASWRARLRLKR